MIESARGVVLRTQRLTETSLIVRWLTRDAGRVSTVARGARRPKSAYSGKLDLFIEADFTFKRSKRSELHTLVEVLTINFHLPLREDVDRLQVCAYCVALIEQTTESDTPLPGLFELFSNLLDQVSIAGARPRLVFAFELKLLDLLGLFPSLDETSLKPAARTLATELAGEDWNDIQKLRATRSTVRELNAFLHGFLIYHLGKIPRKRGEVLKLGDASNPIPGIG